MTPTSIIVLFSILTSAIMGALIGSFANVVIYRVPNGKSIVKPRSACPKCNKTLTPLQLIPVISWLLLRSRCRTCANRISVRYPLVELLTSFLFLGIILRYPVLEYGWTAPLLMVIASFLVMLFFIDLDTLTLPDALTLPAIVIAVGAAGLHGAGSGLPGWGGALSGAAFGAGLLVLINRIGALLLRNYRDTAERTSPIGFDEVNIAALGGMLFGWAGGLVLAVTSMLVNAVTPGARLRLPEPVVYAAWLGAVALASFDLIIPFGDALLGSAVAAGAAALAGAFYWWRPRQPRADELQAEPELAVAGGVGAALPVVEVGAAETGVDEPVAMGFGDVKLAGILGAFLSWQGFLLAFLFAAFYGLLLNLFVGRKWEGRRVVPFGPPLILGALTSLFFGSELIGWYLGLLG